MRGSFLVALFTVLLFTGGYFYYVAQAVCPIPLAYSIGRLDPGFGLTEDEARLAVAEAESVWEDATGQNLFTYDEDAHFTINFIYDERQATRDAEGDFKEKLDESKTASDAINNTYQTLVEEYDTLQVEYSKQVARYEKNLAAYNTQVDELNAHGGANEEEYAVLEERKEELDTQRTDLTALSSTLNNLVAEINKVGDRGNRLIESYNRGVAEYNDSFGEGSEFTQGTYSTQGQINIFAFDDHDELRLVLAHELGHALSLDHVSNEASVMYFLIGGQPANTELTEEDKSEFTRVCSDWTLWDTIKAAYTNR